jgi:heme oxygenase
MNIILKFVCSEDIFLIDFSKCSYDVILKNNIKSSEIYQNSTERYSKVTIDWVYNYLNQWRNKITTIPKYILDKNLF